VEVLEWTKRRKSGIAYEQRFGNFEKIILTVSGVEKIYKGDHLLLRKVNPNCVFDTFLFYFWRLNSANSKWMYKWLKITGEQGAL
jgi:hypothetical protein